MSRDRTARRGPAAARDWKRIVRRAREAGAGPEDPQPHFAFAKSAAEATAEQIALAGFRERLARWALDVAGAPPSGFHVVVGRETDPSRFGQGPSAWPGGWVVGLTNLRERATIVLDAGTRATYT